MRSRNIVRTICRIALLVGLVAFASGSACAAPVASPSLPWREEGAGALAERPGIGLIYSRSQAEALREGTDRQASYRAALERCGARVLPLSPLYDRPFLETQLRQLDGLLVPGGSDVDPVLYGQSPLPQLEEHDAGWDRFELRILDFAARRHLPILGICRGLQLINVWRGGTLIQDLTTDRPATMLHRRRVGPESRSCFHPLKVLPGSWLGRRLGVPEIRVNTYHHQAIDRLGRDVRITASSTDGVVEAIEGTGGDLLIGVQFHPEKIRLEDPRFDAIFETFVASARSGHRERGHRSGHIR